MSETRPIALNNLLLDLVNPRLEEGQENQPQTIHAMLRAEGPKTLALAESIAQEGLSPMERLIVIPAADASTGSFVVLEGNRRITALKILAEPALAEAALSPAQNKRLHKWSTGYRQRGQVDKIECVVFATRKEANPWIERRHRGDQGGVGIVRWGATESARFDARSTGKYSPELQVLDYVVAHAGFDEDTREKLRNVSITNLERLVADKEVRKTLGLEIDRKGRMGSRFPQDEILKPLRRIVHDLAHDKIRVADIYTASKRKEYIAGLKSSERPSKPKALDKPQPLVGDEPFRPSASGGTSTSQKPVRTQQPRLILVPTTCKANVKLARVQNIYRELKKLKLEDYPNAVAVLLRVFIELSVDELIEKQKLMTEQQLSNSKLSHKILTAGSHLNSKGHLTSAQLKAVKKAATDQHLLHSSVTTFHQYVHNRHLSPSVSDLRAAWDNLQPFIEAMWP